MEITNVQVIVTHPGRNFVIVKVMTDEGIYGLGDATLNGRELVVAEALEEYIGPWLVGKDPDRVEDTWQQLFRSTYWRGGPVLMTALAGIDMALWDIKGKIADLSVYSLLGGKAREKARAYLHVGADSFEDTLELCEDAMDDGCTALRVNTGISGVPHGRIGGDTLKKLQKGGEKSVNLWDTGPYMKTIPELFDYLRDELGYEVDLMFDAIIRLTPSQSRRLAKELEPYKLFFFEEPMRYEQQEALSLLRSSTNIPLAIGELSNTKWECLPLINNQLTDFLRVDLSHFGGITEAKKLAAMAEPYYIDTAFHGPSDLSPVGHAANVHVDLSIPNFGIQEWVFHGDKVKEVFEGGAEYEDGYLTVPDEPGLGVDIDEKAAKKYGYKREYLPAYRNPDGSVADW